MELVVAVMVGFLVWRSFRRHPDAMAVGDIVLVVVAVLLVFAWALTLVATQLSPP